MLDHTTVMWQTDVTVKRKNMKNKNNIILIIIFVILVGVLIYIVSTDKKENSVVNESTKSYKYEVVNDYSDFFTIENCVNKYFNYLSLNDKDSLMKILDQEYLTSTNNVLEKEVAKHGKEKSPIFSSAGISIYSIICSCGMFVVLLICSAIFCLKSIIVTPFLLIS